MNLFRASLRRPLARQTITAVPEQPDSRSRTSPRLGTSRQLSGVEVWRGGLGGAYLLPTLSSEWRKARLAVGVPWLYPPFPAACPYRFTMASSALPPRRPHRAGLPQWVPQA